MTVFLNTCCIDKVRPLINLRDEIDFEFHSIAEAVTRRLPLVCNGVSVLAQFSNAGRHIGYSEFVHRLRTGKRLALQVLQDAITLASGIHSILLTQIHYAGLPASFQLAPAVHFHTHTGLSYSRYMLVFGNLLDSCGYV